MGAQFVPIVLFATRVFTKHSYGGSLPSYYLIVVLNTFSLLRTFNISVPTSTGFTPKIPYQHLPQMPAQQQAAVPFHPQEASRAHPSRSWTSSPALRMGSCSLDEMLLTIPHGLASAELIRRKDDLRYEIDFQERNPPVLPPTKVKDLPPKPIIPDFHKFPEGISDHERLEIESRNNKIAAEHQKIDRQRNNQAAKKSRQARLEALNNTRVLLNEKTAECAWFRMKVLALGGNTADWNNVPAGVKTRLVKEIDSRVKTIDMEAADVKKREEAKKRADRNRRRAEVKKDEESQLSQSSQRSTVKKREDEYDEYDGDSTQIDSVIE
ncbi:hypothetical protein TGAMA5MH_06336 [Trichoderma gamsii]|uniref:BZIP domain-containing protein n=1 Tax=Trichoderma gamsii TaxID=398673 RepID=A0A2K0T886_9HYPO|nr:hypothetical protein TGAMA5MH_06336 [Trichoderma gamsii]